MCVYSLLPRNSLRSRHGGMMDGWQGMEERRAQDATGMLPVPRMNELCILQTYTKRVWEKKFSESLTEIDFALCWHNAASAKTAEVARNTQAWCDHLLRLLKLPLACHCGNVLWGRGTDTGVLHTCWLSDKHISPSHTGLCPSSVFIWARLGGKGGRQASKKHI